jgi:hypothetical protein
MPSDITVVVADAVQTAAIRSGLPVSGRVMWFTDGTLAAALDSIRMNHPKVIAVEAGFAERPQGQTFLSRVEELGIRGSAIRLVVRAAGSWATSPYASTQPAPTESPSVGVTVAASAARQVPQVTGPAVVAALAKAASTRRASRFKVLEGLNAVVEEGRANLVNISILGAQVVSVSALRPTQVVKIVLPDAKDMVHLAAHVAWSMFERPELRTDPFYRVGMEFTDAARDILENYCRRHCSQDPLPSY